MFTVTKRLWLCAEAAFIFVLAAAAHALPVDDRDFACIAEERAQRYVREFNIDLASFGGLQLCEPSSATKKLFNDLTLLEEGRFATGGGNLFIRGIAPEDGYLDWLRQRTHGIRRGDDMPYAVAYNLYGQFTMQDGWMRLSSLGRVGTIVHEARHTDGHRHGFCKRGPYKDTRVPGCDSSVEEGGSHAVEMEYYARVVARGANFHPVYQAMARLMLLARSNFVFNKNPLSAHDALLARTDAGFIQFKNGQRREWLWRRGSHPDGRLKRTSFGAALLTPTAAAALNFESGGTVSPVNDEFSYFKLLQGKAPPAQVRDFEEYDEGDKRAVAALDHAGNLYGFAFAEGQWSPPRFVPRADRLVTTAPNGRAGLYVVTDDARYCRLSAALQCAAAPEQWPPDARAFVNFQGNLLQLTRGGVVLGGDGEAWADLRGARVIDLVIAPAYDVFDADVGS